MVKKAMGVLRRPWGPRTLAVVMAVIIAATAATEVGIYELGTATQTIAGPTQIKRVKVPVIRRVMVTPKPKSSSPKTITLVRTSPGPVTFIRTTPAPHPAKTVRVTVVRTPQPKPTHPSPAPSPHPSPTPLPSCVRVSAPLKCLTHQTTKTLGLTHGP